jgi:tetratricopeptide (TPR) repeat protein
VPRFPDVEFRNWPDCERLLPHAKICAALIEKFSFEFEEATRLLTQAAFYMEERAQYAEAMPLFQRSLAIRKNVLGPDDPDVATSLNNLAQLYFYQGRYAEAQPLYKHSLAIREKALGSEHRLVGISLDNLAVLYKNQGKYIEAEPLYQRSIEILKKALGPQHHDVAISMNNLANLYRNQGRYSEAEPLYLLCATARVSSLQCRCTSEVFREDSPSQESSSSGSRPMICPSS